MARYNKNSKIAKNSKDRHPRLPSTIYHYCSIDTLTAILQYKTLRLTDITKSNDSAELTWITNYINLTFNAAFRAERSKKFHAAIDEDLWGKIVKHSVKDWFDTNYRLYSFYVMCFSTEDDLLSQWRGYADDAAGVSIGFNVKALQKVIAGRESVLSLNKVIYNKNSQRSVVRVIANDFIKNLKSDINIGRFDDLKDSLIKSSLTFDKNLRIKVPDRNFTTVALHHYFNGPFNNLFDKAVIVKNPFFREEKEYRICYRFMEVLKDADKYAFNESGNIVLSNNYEPSNDTINAYGEFEPFSTLDRDGVKVPYTDLCFEKGLSAGLNVITSIRRGPKCTVDKDKIREMLVVNGFNDSKIRIMDSDGTYR